MQDRVLEMPVLQSALTQQPLVVNLALMALEVTRLGKLLVLSFNEGRQKSRSNTQLNLCEQCEGHFDLFQVPYDSLVQIPPPYTCNRPCSLINNIYNMAARFYMPESTLDLDKGPILF